MMTRLNIARALIILGFLVGLGSLGATVGHIGDPAYMVRPGFDGGESHAWYHAFREAFGSIAAMTAVLSIWFAGPRYRTPLAWWVCLILMLGLYLPYWAGMPFMDALSAPDTGAEINHVSQAALALAGLFYGRGDFFKSTADAVK